MALVDMSRKLKPWNQYLQPTQYIHPRASAVNKLTIKNDKLCYNDVECKNVLPAEEGISKLKKYLYKNFPNGVTLIAHNGDNFDFPLLRRDWIKYNRSLDKNYCIHCVDSISLFKRQFPSLGRYNQPYLLERFLGSENIESEHEAIGDCINLRSAIEAAAKEKNISLAEFLSIPGRPLYI